MDTATTPECYTSENLETRPLDRVVDAYLSQTPLAHAVFRAAELQAVLGIALQRPVLEVGCGVGQFARFALVQSADVGVDVSPRRIARAQLQGCYLRLECCDACHLPFANGEFKSALCISVLEHTRRPREIVAEMFRALAPGGKAVATIVLADLHRDLWYPRLCERIGLGVLGRAYRRAQDWAFDHITLLGQDEWEDMFRLAGFDLSMSTRAVAPATLAWWDALLPFALPYRLADALGIPSVWRPRWIRRLLGLGISRLLRREDGSGACLVLLAEKPGGVGVARDQLQGSG